MILWQSDIQGGKHIGNKNIKSTVRGHHYLFLCNAGIQFEERHLVVKMQTSYQREHSCRSGFGKITFLQAKLIIHLTISWDRHHSYTGKKINIHRDFAIFTVYSTEWHIVFHCDKDFYCHFRSQCHQQQI